jgi:hypothetical protein
LFFWASIQARFHELLVMPCASDYRLNKSLRPRRLQVFVWREKTQAKDIQKSLEARSHPGGVVQRKNLPG